MQCRNKESNQTKSNSIRKQKSNPWNKSVQHSTECNHKPFINFSRSEHDGQKLIESQSQQRSRKQIVSQSTNRKRKYNMISSPDDYNTLLIDNNARPAKRLKLLSPSKGSDRRQYKDSKLSQNPFSSFNSQPNYEYTVKSDSSHANTDSSTFHSPHPARKPIDNECIQSNSKHLFTSYDDDQTPARSLKHMTQFRRERVLNQIQNGLLLPSSASKTSESCEAFQSNKKRKKIIIESERDIDDLMNVDPRRLSLDEHPLMISSTKNKKPLIYSQQTVDEQEAKRKEEETKQVSSILDGLLSSNSDKENETNMDIITVIHEEEEEETNYFDDDLDDLALLQAVEQVTNVHLHKQNTNIIKRLSFNQNQCNNIEIQTKRYLRFQVMEIFMDEMTPCKVLRVKHIICVDEDTDINEMSEWSIELREDWLQNDICIDDIIHVIGENVEALKQKYEEDNNGDICMQYPRYMIANENIPMIQDDATCMILDNEHNYLVLHPDSLMIPTTIAGSFPCWRKSVINHNVKFSKQTSVMLFGNMAHELFQEQLNKTQHEHDLKSDIQQIIKKNMIDLYSVDENEASATEKLSQFIGNIHDFLNKYMMNHGNNKKHNVVDWGAYKQALNITKLVDIEENIWSPMFGIKGNIDATIQGTTDAHNNVIKILPFELKTGKENPFSVLKARAQLAMYSLMIADRYDTSTDGGLLYYLKTGHLMGIPLPHNEIRALLIRRNLLAKYFQNKKRIKEDMDQKEEAQYIQKEIPQLLSIHQKRSCINCFSKNECFIYHKMQCFNANIKDENECNISGNELYKDIVSHLKQHHLQYLCKWIECIDFEENYCVDARHEMWTMSSRRRESKKGTCLANMVVSAHEIQGFQHVYTFKKHPDEAEELKLWKLKFSVGTYVIISTETGKYGLGKGKLTELNSKYVKFSSRKPIQDLSIAHGGNNVMYRYRVDMDHSKGFGFNSLRANVLYYFFHFEEMDDMRPSIERKRKLLVDMIPPQFGNKAFKMHIPPFLCSAYNALNIDQQNAVKHVMECNDYALILGMPGTGKSSTIIFLLRLLTSFGHRVMLSAFTNLSIDHLCLKLLAHEDTKHAFVRIGNAFNINHKLVNHQLDSITFDSIASIEQYIDSKKIFAVTSHSATKHCILDKCHLFDYCIVDEAGQLTEPRSLGPLRKCDKFILVGDSNQLPPLVQSKEAKNKGMSISLFERLLNKYADIACKSLTIQYRMNADIMSLSNCLIYNGKMKCGSRDIAKQKIKLDSCSKADPSAKWLQHAIDPDASVVFFDTDNLYIKDKKSVDEKRNVNEYEAKIVDMIVNTLFQNGITSSQIGIMTPYRSQLKLIKSKVFKITEYETNDLLLDTIDRFQGSDRDIILISFTHTPSNANKVGQILTDWRRINVALTRAKRKLILIASVSALNKSQSNILKQIVNITKKQKWIYQLPLDI